MRILITQETDWLTKTPAQQHHLAEMLSLKGHQVRVIDYELLWRKKMKRGLLARRQVFPAVSKIHRGAGIDVIRPGMVQIPGLVYASLIFSHKKEIERQMKDFQPDVIVGFGILNSYSALRAAADHGIPFVYYWIDVLDLLIPFKAFQPLGKLVEKLTLKKAHRVLTINEKLREYVVRMGAPPERTSVIRAGINFSQFKEVPENKKVFSGERNGSEEITLFFMGWLYDFSGLKEVARELTRHRQKNIRLLIVGEGDAYDELKKIREKYDLHDRLILTGRRPYTEMPALIAASDVCLLPAYPREKIMQDIVPIKTYEYMAMSKPVISTRLPGVMMEFGEDHGVVYVDNPEDVIPKALELAAGNRLGDLGEKARKFVESNSWEKVTREFESVLEEAVKETEHEKSGCL